jgi:hypothetical protein
MYAYVQVSRVSTLHLRYSPGGQREGRRGTSGGERAHTRDEMTLPRAAARRYFPTSPFKPPLTPPPPDVFAVQDQVTHDKYGLGRVMSIEDGTSVVIDFRTHRVRILTPYAKLTKL